ncbi:MAG: hypothetical protein LBV12_02855 [Puniceicoccales bacterium]|jgi:hypothetical protein|nr:hypothetical protein [Puniceicoccales bacterium]
MTESLCRQPPWYRKHWKGITFFTLCVILLVLIVFSSKPQPKQGILLGTLGGDFSEACAINGTGQIVGRAWNEDPWWLGVWHWFGEKFSVPDKYRDINVRGEEAVLWTIPPSEKNKR